MATRPRYLHLVWLLLLFLLPPLGLMLVSLACNATGSSAATLQVSLFTPTPVPTQIAVPTALIPLGAASTPPIDPQVRDLLDLVQSDRLMIDVGTLADMRSRHVLSKKTDTIGGIAEARDWLVKQFSAIRDANPQQPIAVWTQEVPFSWNGNNLTLQNVVGIFQGADVGAGVIVLGAHYDSISGDFNNGQAIAPGANDDGSGISAMLEVAHILAPLPHRATILFVAFTAEETGRQGSLAFVKNYLQAQNPPIEVRAMLNLDTIGSELGPDGADDPHSIRLFSGEPNDSLSRQLARQVALIISTYVQDATPVLESAEERVGRWGDQQSFSAAGYPSLRFIQGLEDMTRLNTPRDTLDGVQPSFLIMITRAALASVQILADGPMPPHNLSMDSSESDPATQTLHWSPVAGAAHYLVTLRQATSLNFDQIFTVDASAAPELTWNSFSHFSTVAIATIDGNGEMGPLSPEVPIASLVRK